MLLRLPGRSINMQLKYLFYTASVFTSAFATSSASDLINDMSTVNSMVTTLQNGIAALPMTGVSRTQALDVHISVDAVVGAIERLATRARDINGRVSVEDSKIILNDFYNMRPSVNSGLSTLIEKKDALSAIGSGRAKAVINLDLVNLKRAVADFEAPLLVIIPVEYREDTQNALDYNIPGGKMNRGMAVVDTVEILKRRPLIDDEYMKAAVLGWCIELLQGCILVADDIMDASITRRGRPCWYRNPGVVYFKKDPSYIDLVELFLETTWQTGIGQLTDLTTATPGETVNFSEFTLQRYSSIVIWKTAYYSFYLPVACAMYMCGIPNTPLPSLDPSEPAKDPYNIAKSILIPLGEYFQVQDDYLDFAGSPEQVGKIGTDIVDNKCSWCINTALLHATPAQRQVLEEHYGKGSIGGSSELKVKAIFDEIGLREKYAKYEEDTFKMLREKIAKIPQGKHENALRREVFEVMLEKIYRRMC
ncbi:hypothetical protein D9756_010503 [Leucocoprinus leucothites]|uniref:(2E,6E)-farnesyl diphosphate synthase n=1 Tax=Leucocoprinus leucothites TaxID=201217 RepID=A0A8H5CUG3_9AGAR|nr:hypothetical protein D9756_010503 [Leucoagaricus leucothites]